MEVAVIGNSWRFVNCVPACAACSDEQELTLHKECISESVDVHTKRQQVFQWIRGVNVDSLPFCIPQKYLLAGSRTKSEKSKVQIEQCGSQLIIPAWMQSTTRSSCVRGYINARVFFANQSATQKHGIESSIYWKPNEQSTLLKKAKSEHGRILKCAWEQRHRFN